MTTASTPDFTLTRNPFGKLVLTRADGIAHEGVAPVRAFPVGAPGEGIALMSAEGKELVWIDRPGELPVSMQKLLDEELAGREFMPEIRRIRHVSTFYTPSVWDVETDRGNTQLVLKGEEHIRRLTHATLSITDAHGVHFLIRDHFKLDRHSRKLLDRFL